jgi:hypothetical protein
VVVPLVVPLEELVRVVSQPVSQSLLRMYLRRRRGRAVLRSFGLTLTQHVLTMVQDDQVRAEVLSHVPDSLAQHLRGPFATGGNKSGASGGASGDIWYKYS